MKIFAKTHFVEAESGNKKIHTDQKNKKITKIILLVRKIFRIVPLTHYLVFLYLGQAH